MNTHPLDEMWSSVDNELPDGWVFDGMTRGLLCWIATAALYPSRTTIRMETISASSPSPIEAIQKMINRVKAAA